MMSRVVRSALCASALILLHQPSALAWGHEGHRVIARIAARNLSAAARQKVAAILGVTDAGLEDALASAATWPDEIDKSATQTDGWHFINAPIAKRFSINGLCVAHNCVIDQIAAMQTRLASNATGFALPVAPVPDRPMTSQELAFLVHFVGDVHQPLHSATDGDRGGNCVPLTSPLAHPDGTSTTELHAVWDTDVVLAVFATLGDETATASALYQRFQNGSAAVTQGTPTDWAHEAYTIAKSAVYHALHIPNRSAPDDQCAPGIAPVTVTPTYIRARAATVERQLLRAGIRLSNVLNQICVNGCAATP